MRIGLDLRSVPDSDRRLERAVEADLLGLWAVLIGGRAGTEAIEAAEIAVSTSTIHLAVVMDQTNAHPHTMAEEIAVLDHLSQRRILAIVEGDIAHRDHMARLLAGQVVHGVALTPPPAQTQVNVWDAAAIDHVAFTGELRTDAATIDERRDDGCTHLFVDWPGLLMPMARHLVARAAGPGFPPIVAEMADRLDHKT